MLTAIHKDGGDVSKYVEPWRRTRTANFRLMGFGHRVYKNFDPRAKIIKAAADKVLTKLGKPDPLLDIAKALEEAALKDSYFVERKLYPNVDFYSGIIYRAMGFPTNMFTVLFALGRLPGLDRALEGDDGGHRPRRSPGRGRSTRGRRCGTTWRWRSGRSPKDCLRRAGPALVILVRIVRSLTVTRTCALARMALASGAPLLLVSASAAAQPADASIPAVAQTKPVVVHVDAPESVTLEMLDRNGDWQPICTSPCDKPLPSTETYRITGAGIRDSRKFGLDDKAPQTLRVEPTSSVGHAMAVVVTVLGIAGLVPGLSVTTSILAGEIAGVILICPIAIVFVPQNQQSSEYGNCLGSIATFFGQGYASPFVWAPALASVVLLPAGIAWVVNTPPTAVKMSATGAAAWSAPPALAPVRYDALSLPSPTIVPIVNIPF